MTFTDVNVGINAHAFIDWKQAAQTTWALDNVTNALKGQKLVPFLNPLENY